MYGGLPAVAVAVAVGPLYENEESSSRSISAPREATDPKFVKSIESADKSYLPHFHSGGNATRSRSQLLMHGDVDAAARPGPRGRAGRVRARELQHTISMRSKKRKEGTSASGDDDRR